MRFFSDFFPSIDNRTGGLSGAVPPVAACRVVLAFILCTSLSASGATASCPRPLAGATVEDPPELRSVNGTLEVTLHVKYQQTMLGEGPPRYCYVTDEGLESPTLRVAPGDQLIIHLHNDLPAWSNAGGSPSPEHAAPNDDCAGMAMDPSFTNLHFH